VPLPNGGQARLAMAAQPGKEAADSYFSNIKSHLLVS